MTRTRLNSHLNIKLMMLPLLFGVSLLTACQENTAEVTPSIPVVKTMSLVHQTADESWHLSGTLVARYTSDIAFRVSGKITERLVDVGDTVQANQVLYRLDATDYQLARDVATANVEATQSDIQFSESELARLKKLIKRNLTTEQAVDQAKNQVTVLKAHLRALRLQSQQAQNQLNYTVLKSPGLGKILAIHHEEDEVVTTGQAVASVALAGHREVVVQIPESRLQTLPTQAQVKLSGSEEPLSTTLRVIALQADPLSRTWEARYTLQPRLSSGGASDVSTTAMDALSLGQTAKLTFATSSALFKVPNTAIYEQGDYASLWLVEDGKVFRKAVNVGALSESSAWVSALNGGLNEASRIVVLGVHLLSEGQMVRESAQ